MPLRDTVNVKENAPMDPTRAGTFSIRILKGSRDFANAVLKRGGRAGTFAQFLRQGCIGSVREGSVRNQFSSYVSSVRRVQFVISS